MVAATETTTETLANYADSSARRFDGVDVLEAFGVTVRAREFSDRELDEVIRRGDDEAVLVACEAIVDDLKAEGVNPDEVPDGAIDLAARDLGRDVAEAARDLEAKRSDRRFRQNHQPPY